MLQISGLKVNVGEKVVLNDINFNFQKGRNYAILGKNGSGKSSLMMSIMGNPKYQIKSGEIILDEENISDLSADKRAQKGIFLAFQNIPEIPGVKVFDFLKAIYNSSLPKGQQVISFLKFKKLIEPLIDQVGLNKDFLFRDVNAGFSGGEKRKLEILQLKLLNPKYIFLDEIDSGLDINAIKELGETLKSLQSQDISLIIISHYFEILNYIDINEVILMENGQVKMVGSKSLIDIIKKDGF